MLGAFVALGTFSPAWGEFIDKFVHRNNSPFSGLEFGTKQVREAGLPFKNSLVILLSKGETTSAVLKIRQQECQSLSLNWISEDSKKIKISVFEMVPIEIREKSFPSAEKGTTYDPLLPLENDYCPKNSKSTEMFLWIDIEAPAGGTAQTYLTEWVLNKKTKIPMDVRVINNSLSTSLPLPVFAPLDIALVNKAHKLTETSQVLMEQYFEALTSHSVFPTAVPNQQDEFQKITKKFELLWPKEQNKKYSLSCLSHGCEKAEDLHIPDFVIDRPDSYILSLARLSQVLKIKSVRYTGINAAFKNTDPWKEFFVNSGNGDGTLVFPGVRGQLALTKDQPITTIRLKNIRTANFLSQYFAKIEALPNPPDFWVPLKQRLGTSETFWLKNTAEYYAARKQIIDHLTKTQDR